MEWCRSYDFVPKKKIKKKELTQKEVDALLEQDEKWQKIKRHIEEQNAYTKKIREELHEINEQIDKETDPLKQEHLLFKQASLIQKLV